MSIITTIKKLRSGYTVGTRYCILLIKISTFKLICCRVTLGSLQDFLSTSCLTNLSFLGSVEDGIPESELDSIFLWVVSCPLTRRQHSLPVHSPWSAPGEPRERWTPLAIRPYVCGKTQWENSGKTPWENHTQRGRRGRDSNPLLAWIVLWCTTDWAVRARLAQSYFKTWFPNREFRIP